jgi:hypothetical protein
MKFATVSKSLVMGLALLLTSSALAATKASLTLQNPTIINGTKLKPGDYKLQWDGSGPNVEVSIMQGRTVLAKVPAKVVDLNSPAEIASKAKSSRSSWATRATGCRPGPASRSSTRIAA